MGFGMRSLINIAVIMLAMGALACSNQTAPLPEPPAPAAPPAVAPTATSIPATPEPPEAAVKSTIVDFNLENITVPIGTTVSWENLDGTAHTSTEGLAPRRWGNWDSGSIKPNNNYTFTFTQTGMFPYFCTIHPNMKGMVIVGDSDTTVFISS